MNILFVLPSLARAGAEIQTVDLANGLSERDHNIHIFVFEPSLDLKERLSSKISLHRIKRQSKIDLNVIRRITSVIDDNDIQIVVAVLAYSVLLTWLARRNTRLAPPIVASLHSINSPHFKAALFDRVVYRWVYRKIEHVIFVCKAQQMKRSRRLAWLKAKSSVVYNGIDEEKFRPEDFCEDGLDLRKSLGIPHDAFVFSCVAQFRPEKRHVLLINAFAQIGENGYLVLAGDGPCRQEASELVMKHRLENRVLFLGNVSDSRPVIAASNATVLASKMESFSMAMLESMALGVPLVAAKVGGLPEAVIEGETGKLFTPGDVSSLREKMQEMMDNPGDALEMGSKSALLVRQLFRRKTMVDTTETLLNAVSQKSANTPG